MSTNSADREVEDALRSAPESLWRQLFEAAHGYLAEPEHASWQGMQPVGTVVIDGEERAVHQMPYVAYSGDVHKVVGLLNQIGVVFPFDWSGWDGLARYRGGDGLRAAPVADAARLATAIVRGDRFCEGLLDGAIRDGTFSAILERLLRWYDAERDDVG